MELHLAPLLHGWPTPSKERGWEKQLQEFGPWHVVLWPSFLFAPHSPYFQCLIKSAELLQRKRSDQIRRRAFHFWKWRRGRYTTQSYFSFFSDVGIPCWSCSLCRVLLWPTCCLCGILAGWPARSWSSKNTFFPALTVISRENFSKNKRRPVRSGDAKMAWRRLETVAPPCPSNFKSNLFLK